MANAKRFNCKITNSPACIEVQVGGVLGEKMSELPPVKQARKLKELFDNIKEPVRFFRDFELPYIDNQEVRFRFQTLENLLFVLSKDAFNLLHEFKRDEEKK